MRTFQLFFWALLALFTLSACGSGTSVNTGTATSTAISGSVVAGAVTGTVTVSNPIGAQRTAPIANGSFTLSIPLTWLAMTLDFSVNGTYRDEVSGLTVTIIPITAPMDLYTAANTITAAGGHVAITPDTAIISLMIKNGMSINQAEQSFQTAFGYLPRLSAHPFDPYATTAAQAVVLIAADPYASDASFRVGMFSQLANNFGLTTAAEIALLPQKLADDLSDGTLDGMKGAASVTFPNSGINMQGLHAAQPLANRLNVALATFTGSTANQAALTPPTTGLPPVAGEPLGMSKLITLANGTQLKLQLDVNYATPFQAGFRVARTHHQLTITDKATGAPVDITALNPVISAVAMLPTMFMNSGHKHSTPQGTVDITKAAQGIYSVDTYYLMSSSMMVNGVESPMGQWQLAFQLTDNTTGLNPTVNGFFFPKVNMNMGGAVLMSKVVNTADQWTNMLGMTNPREYRVWLHDVVNNAGGGYDLTLFLSTLNMGMANGKMFMAFPPVVQGMTINDAKNGAGMRPAVTVTAVLLEVLDVATGTWSAVPSIGGGLYQIVGFAGLAAGANTPQLRLTVNANAMKDAGGNNPALIFNL